RIGGREQLAVPDMREKGLRGVLRVGRLEPMLQAQIDIKRAPVGAHHAIEPDLSLGRIVPTGRADGRPACGRKGLSHSLAPLHRCAWAANVEVNATRRKGRRADSISASSPARALHPATEWMPGRRNNASPTAYARRCR